MGEAKASFGLNTSREVKRVYFEGSTTIYEGMPLCYNYDTTSNILGYDKANSTFGSSVVESDTTAEGYQNEGKYLRVELPTAANQMFFAGAVAGSWCGQTGPRWLEVYVPNGAIVPLRIYESVTVGATALALVAGQPYFGKPAADYTGNGGTRFVALAEETVDRSSTAGLCLARLDSSMFLYQSGPSAKLNFSTTGSTVSMAANFINVSSAATSGGFTALYVRSEVATSNNSDTSISAYIEGNLTGVAAGSWCIAGRSSLNVWGGTQTASLFGLMAEVYEEGATLSSATVAPLAIHDQVTNAPANHYLIYVKCDGADKPDGLLFAASADAVGYATTSNVTGMSHIPIYITGVGLRYILLEDTA